MYLDYTKGVDNIEIYKCHRSSGRKYKKAERASFE